MGSVGAALAGLRSGQPVLPSGHWHNNDGFLRCEILSRQTVLKSFDELNGSVVITVTKEISSHGIFIQLDANVDITVEMKVGIDAATTYKEKKGLLKGSESRSRGFIRSPIRQYLVKNDHRFQPVIKLPPGKFTYHFRLVVPGDQLPCSFIQKFGELKYKLTVYMKQACCYQMMTDKVLEFGGYHNLNLVTNATEPLVHECGLSASIFSSKQCVKTLFTSSDGRCFLPKEEIVFCISVVNPKCYLVKTITACFAQRTIYSANWRKKITLLELNNFESTEMKNDAEINCVGTLSVPENCVPTYNLSPLSVYNVIHVIQYEVNIEGRTTSLKGEVEVVIGTTRATEEEMKRKVQRRSSTVPNLLQGESSSSSPLPIVRRPRSHSIMSRISSISSISTRSLPPVYSQLASRTPSVHSIETLPPHYEDVND